MHRPKLAPRYSRPIPESKLPPLDTPKPAPVVTVTMGALLAALLAGCGEDTRTPAQRSFDNCVTRGMDPTSCAIGIRQVYGDAADAPRR